MISANPSVVTSSVPYRRRGGQRAAAMYSLIVSAKLNGVDPQAWLADVLARIAAHPEHRLDELLPWNWKPAETAVADVAA
jgi:transposase